VSTVEAYASKIPLLAETAGKPGQLGIVVRSMEDALASWGAEGHFAPGWRLWTYSPNTVEELIYRGQPGRFSMRIALGGTAPQVELIEPIDGPSIYHEWLQQHGPGLHHIGFYVSDLRASIARMVARGFPLAQSGVGTGRDGTGGFAYFDTVEVLGYFVEAIVVPTLRRPPEAVWPRVDLAAGSAS
jgi:hypothetical protein